MKKDMVIAVNTIIVIGVVFVLFCMAGCTAKNNANGKIESVRIPSQENLITYEFTTYDHQTVKADEDNIVFQEECANPLESGIVPNVAKQIAPGRNYVCLTDGKYMYVEDDVNKIVTIVQI